MKGDWLKYELEKTKLEILLAAGKITCEEFEAMIRRLAKKLKV